MKDVRIWFTKDGPSRFISHLDTYRCMLRAIKRTKLPIWYTEGFNRHPFMTFSLPLPLGIRSIKDSFDIRLENDICYNETALINKLNDYLPQGLSINSISSPVMKPKEISFAMFEILFVQDGPSQEILKNKLSDFIQQDNIFVIKKSKSGEKKIDLKSYFVKYEISDCLDRGIIIKLVLPAGNISNINPFLFTSSFDEYAKLDIFYDITRVNLFNSDMEIFI